MHMKMENRYSFKHQAEYESAIRFIESASKSDSFDASVAFKEAI